MSLNPIEYWPLARWRTADVEYHVSAINEGLGLVVMVTANASGNRNRTTLAGRVISTAELAAEMIRWHRGTDEERTKEAERLLEEAGLGSN